MWFRAVEWMLVGAVFGKRFLKNYLFFEFLKKKNLCGFYGFTQVWIIVMLEMFIYWKLISSDGAKIPFHVKLERMDGEGRIVDWKGLFCTHTLTVKVRRNDLKHLPHPLLIPNPPFQRHSQTHTMSWFGRWGGDVGIRAFSLINFETSSTCWVFCCCCHCSGCQRFPSAESSLRRDVSVVEEFSCANQGQTTPCCGGIFHAKNLS